MHAACRRRCSPAAGASAGGEGLTPAAGRRGNTLADIAKHLLKRRVAERRPDRAVNAWCQAEAEQGCAAPKMARLSAAVGRVGRVGLSADQVVGERRGVVGACCARGGDCCTADDRTRRAKSCCARFGAGGAVRCRDHGTRDLRRRCHQGDSGRLAFAQLGVENRHAARRQQCRPGRIQYIYGLRAAACITCLSAPGRPTISSPREQGGSFVFVGSQ
jgi:hypothetical protein